MANHVYTTINITGNKEVMDKLEEIKIKVEENNNDNHIALINGFYDNMENTYAWYGENVGAKWCYHDEFWVDIEGEYAEIMTTSAWYPPLELVQHIYKICSPLDVECEIDGDYENEATTPIGGFVVNKNGFVHEEYEGEVEYPDEDNYQTEDGELDDEKYDYAMEEYYERVNNLRGEMKSLAHSNLNILLKPETTTN
jgi:hypothetical protein